LADSPKSSSDSAACGILVHGRNYPFLPLMFMD
jgi:hypothetical protein